MSKASYTTVYHRVRIKLGLSLNEFCIADSICKLSNRPSYPWCLSRREELGAFIGVSKRSTIDIVNKLVRKGLVEAHPMTKKLRATDKWINEVLLEEEGLQVKQVHPPGEESSPDQVKQVHPSIVISNNNNKPDSLRKSGTSENMEEEYEINKNIDPESGEEITHSRWGKPLKAMPKVKVEGKNKIAIRLQQKFIQLCKKEVGVSPVMNMAGYKIVLRALNSGGLAEEKIIDLFEEWFSLGKPDEETVQITRALSDNQVNAYKARNQIS